MLLEKEGLVHLPPRRRPVVTTLTMEELKDNYNVRAVLLGLLMTDIVKKASSADLASLGEFLAKMKTAAKSQSADAYFWANVRFYERAAEIARNITLKRVLDSLLLRALRVRRRSLTLPGRTSNSLADHISLMAALNNRDAKKAAAAIRSNLSGARHALESAMSRFGPEI